MSQSEQPKLANYDIFRNKTLCLCKKQTLQTCMKLTTPLINAIQKN